MKNYIVLGLLILATVVSGCKKDEEDKKPSSYFEYDGKTYELKHGFLENWGPTGLSSYNLDLILLSDSFVLHETGDVLDSITGVGEGLYFEMFASKNDELPAGDYNYNASSYQSGTYDYADFIINYNLETEQGTFFEIAGGKVAVTRNGANYELTFDCTTSNGKSLKGQFKGSLRYFDFDIEMATPFKDHFQRSSIKPEK